MVGRTPGWGCPLGQDALVPRPEQRGQHHARCEPASGRRPGAGHRHFRESLRTSSLSWDAGCYSPLEGSPYHRRDRPRPERILPAAILPNLSSKRQRVDILPSPRSSRPSWVPRHRSTQHNAMERSTLAVWKRSPEGRGGPDGYLRGKTTCRDIEWVYETRRSQVG